jgi:hypothetical protein
MTMAKPKSVKRRATMLTRDDVHSAPGLWWKLDITKDKPVDERLLAVVAWMYGQGLIVDDELAVIGFEIVYDHSGQRLQQIAE